MISACEKGQSESSLADWCILCERIYRYITRAFSSEGFGDGVSWVVTDSICNQHLTSQDCFERAVRLPAALKAAKQAGAGKVDRLRFMASLKQRYLHMAENEVIRRAHSKTYLQRMKKRCMAVVQENEVVPLTEDSDGNGGEDTSKHLFVILFLGGFVSYHLFVYRSGFKGILASGNSCCGCCNPIR